MSLEIYKHKGVGSSSITAVEELHNIVDICLSCEVNKPRFSDPFFALLTGSWRQIKIKKGYVYIHSTGAKN
jgi:hypothetical protein